MTSCSRLQANENRQLEFFDYNFEIGAKDDYLGPRLSLLLPFCSRSQFVTLKRPVCHCEAAFPL